MFGLFCLGAETGWEDTRQSQRLRPISKFSRQKHPTDDFLFRDGSLIARPGRRWPQRARLRVDLGR